MSENKPTIPEMNRYEDISAFWEQNSLADYWDETEPAEFEIDSNARRRYLVAVDPDLLKRLRNVAKLRGLSTESLVNLFLEQRLKEVECT